MPNELEFTVALDRTQIATSERRLLALATIAPGDIGDTSVRQIEAWPLDLVVIIDCSPSMRRSGDGEPSRFDEAITTLWSVVDDLRDDDCCSVIGASSQAKVLLARLPGTQRGSLDRDALETNLRALADGPPDLAGALWLVNSLGRTPSRLCRLIILYGAAGVHEVAEQQCFQNAEFLRAQGVEIYALGYGDATWALLSVLAGPSGERAHSAPPAPALHAILQRARDTIFTEVRLEVAIPPEVRIICIYRLTPSIFYVPSDTFSLRPNLLSLHCGSIPYDTTSRWLIELEVDPSPLDKLINLGTFILSYRLPDGTVLRSTELLLQVARVEQILPHKATRLYTRLFEEAELNRFEGVLGKAQVQRSRTELAEILRQLVSLCESAGLIQKADLYWRALTTINRADLVGDLVKVTVGELALEVAESTTRWSEGLDGLLFGESSEQVLPTIIYRSTSPANETWAIQERRVDVVAPAMLPVGAPAHLILQVQLPGAMLLSWDNPLAQEPRRATESLSLAFPVDSDQGGLRPLVLRVVVEAHGGGATVSPWSQRLIVPPDHASPRLIFALTAREPGRVLIFVRLYDDASSEADPPPLASTCLELRAAEDHDVAPYAASMRLRLVASDDTSALRRASTPQPAGLTIALESGHGPDDYWARLTLHLPEEHDMRELARAEPVLLDLSGLSMLELDPEGYGLALKDALFASPRARRAWDETVLFAEGLQVPLRVRLALDEDGTLQSLRWETLADPRTGLPLAFDRRRLLSRYLVSTSLRRFVDRRRPRHPLRVTIAVANPTDVGEYGLSTINVAAEVDVVAETLAACALTVLGSYPSADSESGPPFTLAVPRATRAAIASCAEGAHILYLVCHGRIAPTAIGEEAQRPYLLLEREDGRAHWVEATAFAEDLLALVAPPPLVVLASCYSAGGESNLMAQALGPLLCRAGLPAVLGFQGLVSQETIRQLMPALLADVAEARQDERAIDAALAKVRVQLREGQWWQPVLWLRRDDGRAW